MGNMPSEWGYLKHFQMTHDFVEGVGTYLGQNANNKTMVKFTQDKNIDSKKGVISRKVEIKSI